MTTYKPLSPRALALYGKDPIERDWSAADEADMLSAGHVEIVPRAYRVLSDNYTAGAQGSTVELALPAEIEAALIFGGHLELADKPAPKAKRGK